MKYRVAVYGDSAHKAFYTNNLDIAKERYQGTVDATRAALELGLRILGNALNIELVGHEGVIAFCRLTNKE